MSTTAAVHAGEAAVTGEASALFQAKGYVVFPQVITASSLCAAQAAYQRMRRKTESGAYPFCRLYDDLLRTNIAGIEHIFHPDIYEPDLFAAVVESRLLQRAQSLLNAEAPVMLLNRIHCTTRYSHTGIWHRDADPGTEPHLQVALFLYDEDRFIAVPGSHLANQGQPESVATAATVLRLLGPGLPTGR